MMLVMVNFHGLRVNVGFQSVECVRQGGHRECHRFVLQCEISLVLCRAAARQQFGSGVIRTKERGTGNAPSNQKCPAVHEELLSAAGRWTCTADYTSAPSQHSTRWRVMCGGVIAFLL